MNVEWKLITVCRSNYINISSQTCLPLTCNVFQVAFLVDCGVIRQPDLSIQQISQLIRLSCLRILSSFHFNKLYKDLRWGYRFYNLDSVPLSAHRHTNWKEFTLESYEDYEAKLGKECHPLLHFDALTLPDFP